MPSAPGIATILVVDLVEDTSQLDSKGHPVVNKVITPVTGCKVAPGGGTEKRNGSTDYAEQPWRIATPPHPSAIGVKPNGLIWYDDNGRYAASTVRDTYDDPDLGVRDVAVLQVIGAQVLTDLADAVDHVTIKAKSELG